MVVALKVLGLAEGTEGDFVVVALAFLYRNVDQHVSFVKEVGCPVVGVGIGNEGFTVGPYGVTAGYACQFAVIQLRVPSVHQPGAGGVVDQAELRSRNHPLCLSSVSTFKTQFRTNPYNIRIFPVPTGSRLRIQRHLYPGSHSFERHQKSMHIRTFGGFPALLHTGHSECAIRGIRYQSGIVFQDILQLLQGGRIPELRALLGTVTVPVGDNIDIAHIMTIEVISPDAVNKRNTGEIYRLVRRRLIIEDRFLTFSRILVVNQHTQILNQDTGAVGLGNPQRQGILVLRRRLYFLPGARECRQKAAHGH